MYRIFIDEIGNSDLISSGDPNQRYLSLTGVVMHLDHHQSTVADEMSHLKSMFFGDDSVVLHRKDILNRNHPFQVLEDDNLRARFDSRLLHLLTSWQYRAITVVIDKQEHRDRYGIWHFHPYHYCMMVLMERYVMHLEGLGETGDVMAESRQRKDNEKLDESYGRFYERGTEYVSSRRFQSRLTSRQLKIKEKKANVPGLQIADLLANPSWRGLLCARLKQPMTANFGSQIVDMLHEGKYLTSPNGKEKGWGLKWLPN